MSSNTFGKLLFYSFSVVGTGLGTWQVQRYYWKVDKIAQSKSSFDDEALSIPQPLNQKELFNICDDLKMKKIKLKGEYINGHDVLLGLRSAPLLPGKKAAQGMSVNPQGYYVFSPFRLTSNSGNSITSPIVYVNRGWIGMKQCEWKTPSGITDMECIVTGAEKSSIFSPPHDISSKKLLWLDGKALKEASELDYVENDDIVIVDLLEEKPLDAGNFVVSSLKGVVQGLSPSKTTPNNPIVKSANSSLQDHYVTPETHVAYAFTWYSLAICSLGIVYFKFHRVPPSVKKLVK